MRSPSFLIEKWRLLMTAGAPDLWEKASKIYAEREDKTEVGQDAAAEFAMISVGWIEPEESAMVSAALEYEDAIAGQELMGDK